MGSILEVSRLSKRFGGLTAVSELDFEVREGEILGMIGPNGAGKSTTFNLIAGAYPASSGEVVFQKESILGLPPHQIARRGVLRTFQHNRPFEGMPVIDNVLVGAHTRFRLNLFGRQSRSEEEERRHRAEELIEFVGLGGLAQADVGTLSFGQGRLLEIARALAGEPRLILFDEPAAGLAPAELDRLAEIIRGIAARGIAVLLIEHDMHFLLPLAHRVVVLNFGAKIADGLPDDIRRNPAVMDAYLGAMLQIRDLTAGYGQAPVLQGVRLHVVKGETVALLGPNGAGKSTLMAAITGTIRRSGSIEFAGKNLVEEASHTIVSLGASLVPEGRLVFPPFTVEDNLRLGAVRLKGSMRERFDFVYGLFPRLAERRRQPAGTLSGGEQQMLAIGRALMSAPRLLLLDEPFLGLAPMVVVEIRASLEKLRQTGTTLLMVEQKLDIALSFASRAYVLIKGRVVLEDSTASLARRPDLRDLYFSLATSSAARSRA